MTAIERKRGDNDPFQLAVVDDADTPVAIDITGWSFLMTVDTLKAPPDVSTQVFQLIGVITDAGGGLVEFSPTEENMDQLPAKYFYDMQRINVASDVKTLVLDEFKIVQDITKQGNP